MRKILLVALAILLVLPVALVGAMRAMRGNAQGPHPAGPASAGVLRVRNLFTEIYGVRAGRDVVLFDGGIDKDGQALDVLLAGLHATRDDVTHVFLTHGHFDHVQHSPLCTRAKIHVGSADLDLLATRVTAGRTAARWFGACLPPPAIEANAPLIGEVELPLDAGKTVYAVPVPGHTAGSYVYLFDAVLFAGDSINVDGDRLDFAMGPFTDDIAANHRSIAALRSFVDKHKVDTVCTGHMACTPEGRGGAMLTDLMARAEQTP